MENQSNFPLATIIWMIRYSTHKFIYFSKLFFMGNLGLPEAPLLGGP